LALRADQKVRATAGGGSTKDAQKVQGDLKGRCNCGNKSINKNLTAAAKSVEEQRKSVKQGADAHISYHLPLLGCSQYITQ